MKNKKKLLTGPYLFWAVSFIIIPLFMILYYGLTNEKKEFTLLNLAKITTPENLKSTWSGASAVACQHCDLSDPGVSACYDTRFKKHESDKLYRLDLHPPDVDEFPASYPCMADIA